MWSIETFKKRRNKGFFHDALQLNKIWPTEKKCTHKAPAIALKEKKHFSKLNLHFPDFFQVWKTTGQISRFFQEFKTLYEPCQV